METSNMRSQQMYTYIFVSSNSTHN